ncbi:MAG: DedA family protein, partial [bacterium]|nr:DedA family protein [bacterium]
MEHLLETLAAFVISSIEAGGYAGIALLMALESANIPIPSEIIMPFSGFLVSQGALDFWPVVFWGAMGNLIGSLVSYAAGYWGGRPFLHRYGRFFFLFPEEVAKGEMWLKRYQSPVAFF